MSFIRCLLFLILAFGVLHANNAQGYATYSDLLSDDDLYGNKLSEEISLSFSVNYKGVYVGDLVAYQTLNKTFIPLSDVVRILGFNIEVNSYTGVASGWFIQPNRIFVLNYFVNQAIINGKAFNIPKGLVILGDKEIFVDSSLLSQFFGINFNIDDTHLSINLHPNENIASLQHALKASKLAQHTIPALPSPDKEGQESSTIGEPELAEIEEIIEKPVVPKTDDELWDEAGEPEILGFEQSQHMTEENLIILQLHLNDIVFEEYIEGYYNDTGYFISMKQLALTLDLALNVNAEEGYIDGWVIKEENTLDVDIYDGKALLGDEKIYFSPDLVVKIDDDIYVDHLLLSKWLPAGMDIDPLQLLLHVSSHKNFPIQDRLRRAKILEKLQEPKLEAAKYELIKPPYKAASWPFTDVSLSYMLDNESSERNNDTNYSIVSSGDLGYFNVQSFANGSFNEGLSTMRIKGERRSDEGNMLGFFNAKKLSIGDINSLSMPLVASSSLGSGVSVTNRGTRTDFEFDTIDLTGDATPEWEVELYRNQTILDIQIIGSDGRYEFLSVPVLYGNNMFRLVFYGPQGQIEEKIVRRNIGSEMIKPGEFHYSFSVDDKSESLIKTGSEQGPSHPSKTRFVGNVEYGLFKNLSIMAGGSSTALDDGIHDYFSTSLRSSIGGSLVNFDYAYDMEGHKALKLTALSSFKSINMKIEQKRFSQDFESERETSNGKRLTEIDISSSLPIPFVGPTNVGLNVKHEITDNSDKITTYKSRISTSSFGVAVNNNTTTIITDATENYSGTFNINSKLNGFLLRGSSNYVISPEGKVNDVRAIAQKKFGDLTAKIELSKDYTGTMPVSYSGSLSQDLKKYRLSFQLDGDDEGKLDFLVNMTFSFGRDPIKKKWQIFNKNSANKGGIIAQTFFDSNGNGKVDDEDKPAGDEVVFRVGRHATKVGENGGVFSSSVPVHTPVNVIIDASSDLDPLSINVPEGYSVLTRPGVSVPIKFLIVPSSEIDGTVYLDGEPIADVLVELIDENNVSLGSVAAEFDGFYLLDRVLKGKYKLRVSDDDLKKLGATQQKEVEIIIGSKSDIYSNYNIFLEADSVHKGKANNGALPEGN